MEEGHALSRRKSLAARPDAGAKNRAGIVTSPSSATSTEEDRSTRPAWAADLRIVTGIFF
jgi:hypothetical protein